MAEITLQQIAELLAAQEARMDQKLAAQTNFMRQELAAQEARMDQKLAAQEARMDEKFDAQAAQFASLEARMDQKLTAQEARIDQKLSNILKDVKETVSTVVLEIGEQLAAMEERMVNNTKVLLEEFECWKIRPLFEESGAHKATLVDHEIRIVNLEAAGH